jgi:hypothetical protein
MSATNGGRGYPFVVFVIAGFVLLAALIFLVGSGESSGRGSGFALRVALGAGGLAFLVYVFVRFVSAPAVDPPKEAPKVAPKPSTASTYQPHMAYTVHCHRCNGTGTTALELANKGGILMRECDECFGSGKLPIKHH